MDNNKNTKRLLIVEDERDLSKAYVELFQKEGFEVSSAASGTEGIEKALSFRPDLILLDLILPGKSGFDVLAALRADDSFASVPIFVLTNIFADKSELMNKGANAVYMKSDHTPDDVVGKVRELLSMSS